METVVLMHQRIQRAHHDVNALHLATKFSKAWRRKPTSTSTQRAPALLPTVKRDDCCLLSRRIPADAIGVGACKAHCERLNFFDHAHACP
jgi:hypothetical protein